MRLTDVRNFFTIQRAQWKTPRELHRIQGEKLARLIRHAWKTVPYYRDLFASSGLSPGDIREGHGLGIIPITTKRTLQNLALEEKISAGTDIRRCKTSATSGTTGMPLTIYTRRQDTTMMNFSWARAYLASGMKPWSKIAVFVGRSDTNAHTSWYEYLGLWQKHEISAWQDPDDWIRELRAFKPNVIAGYVMTLRLLAEAIQTKGIDDIRPQLIFHSSAILDDSSRRLLQAVFRAPVIDFYGADEAGCIAWECPRCAAYHLNTDLVVVETSVNGRPAGPGEEGEVLVTSLHSYAMPFIRYALGDVAVLSAKVPLCGRGFLLMEKIWGRTDDLIILKNGRKISPHPIYHCLDPVPGIHRWRVVQKTVRQLLVDLELGPSFSSDTISQARENLMRLFKGDIEVVIRTAASIPISPQSKFRAVQSEIRNGRL